MTINVDPVPVTANISVINPTLCASNTATNLTGNSPTPGSGLWTLQTGTVSITTPTLNTTGVTGVGTGTSVLRWTISTGTTCPASIATMTIKVDPLPTTASISVTNPTVCASNNSISLTGNNPSTGSGIWTLQTGTVTITTPTLNITGVTGVGTGTNELLWTISTGTTCPVSIATMTIKVDPLPTIASISVTNPTLCASGNSTVLTGNNPSTGSGLWTLQTGTASITTPTLNTTGVTGVGTGTSVLRWTISTGTTCPASIATMTIKVDPLPTIANISVTNPTLCANANNTVLTGNNPINGTGTWSVQGGSAAISNVNQFNSPVTGVAVGSNTLIWNISTGTTCPSSAASMTIKVDPLPSTASISITTPTLCANNPTTTLTGIAPGPGTGLWSLQTGTATITTPTLNNTGITSVGTGTSQLRWTVSTGTTCPSSIATMTVKVDPMPSTANITITNPTLCASSNSTSLTGSVPGPGTGIWTLQSGIATITTNTLNNTTVTGIGTVSNNVLVWTISTGTTCPFSSATMTIQVDAPSGLASTGGNQTLCVSSPVTFLTGNSPTPGVGTWSITSGSMSIVDVNDPITAIGGAAVGLNGLQWSIKNGVCPPTIANMTVQVDNLPAIPNPGASQTVCVSAPNVTLSGNTPGPFSGVGSWAITTGSGVVTSINNPSTTVTALASGTNILQWSISNFCGTNTNTMAVQVDLLPTTSVAGANQASCSITGFPPGPPTVTLGANAPTIGNGIWSVVSGTGTFSNQTSPVSTFSNLGVGNNVLQWTIVNGVCPPSISTTTVHVDDNGAPLSAGPNQTICATTTIITMAAIQPTVGSSIWNPLVPNASSPASLQPVFTNPTLGITTVTNMQLGFNKYEWLATNGACGVQGTFVNIYVHPPPPTATIVTPSQTLCVTNSITTVTAITPTPATVSTPPIGTFTNTGTWSFVQGGGTIANPTLATTAVTLNMGANILQWSVGNNGVCSPNNATVMIAITGTPSIANAGANQTICVNSSTTTLAAATPTGGVGSWSVDSGTASITTPTLPNSPVTGLGVGINVLRWSVNSGCVSGNSSTMSIQVDAMPPAAIAGPNQTICITSPTTVLSATSPTLGPGTWSLMTGAGVLSNSTSVTSPVTALGSGTNTFRWQTVNGTCLSNSTLTVIVNNPPTTATAQANQSVCITSPSINLTGSIPSLGIGNWTIVSGSGTITTPSLGTSPISGLITGTTTAVWNIANSGCGVSSATTNIHVFDVPGIANAGSSQTVCANTGSVALAANSPTVGIGTWSVISGPGGTISNSTSPTATISGLSVGTTVLQWMLSNGTCSSVSTMSVQVFGAPSNATVGPNQILCITTPTTALTGNIPSVGTGSWTILSGGGTINSSTLGTSGFTASGVGTTVLQWNITNGICTSSSPFLSVQVFGLPGPLLPGPDQTICETTGTTVLAASAPTIGVISWSVVSGSGSLSGSTIATPTITGLTAGTTLVQYNITNGPCINSTTLTIGVDTSPTTPVAGSNQSLCASSNSTTLVGNNISVGTGSWSVISGTCTITSPTLNITTLTGLATGTNILGWVSSNGVCTSSTSTLSVEVFGLPGLATAGPDQTVCINSPSIVLAANAPTLGTGFWTVQTGTGAVTSPTLNNSGITGLSSGLNVLEWTLSNGTCTSTSVMSIFADDAPDISMAGSNELLCITNPSVTLNANTPSIGTGSWTVVSGSVTVLNPTLATSAATSASIGVNVLEWSISNGVCAPSTSSIVITVGNLAVPSVAGSNQTICASSPSANLSANTPSSGVGTWSLISGQGTLTNPTLAVTTITNLGSSPIVLEWTISDGGCTSTSSLAILLDAAPDPAVAGSDQFLCINSPTANVNAISPVTGTGSWSLIAGSGLITNSLSATTSVTGLGTGTNVLEWAVSNGVCAPNISTLALIVDNLALTSVAGSNQTICISTPTAGLSANTPTIGMGAWSVISGAGTVSDPTLAVTTVTDLASGPVVLEWTITNGGCTSTSSLSIQLDASPDPAVAGSDQILCISSPTTTVNATVPIIGTGSWSLIAGAGSITNSLSANTTITGLSTGTNVLEWTVSNGVCASNISTISLVVDNLAVTSVAGSNQTICISTPTANLSANTPTIGTGVWSIISGSGTISDPTLAVTTVTDLASSPIVLEWTITNGGCSSTSSLSVQLDAIPDLAVAGANQALCISSPTTLLNATIPLTGVGTWSLLSGSGTITNSLSANSSFTALATGTNVLQWMVANGVCAPSISTVTLVVDNLAVPSVAGPNQTVCVNSTATLAANTPTFGVGSWSVISGNASVTDATLATTTANNFAVGITVFEWTITNGACTSISSLSVQGDEVPDIANAGLDQMLCVSSPSTILSAPSLTVGSGSWSVMVGSGVLSNSTSPTSSITSLATGTNILQWTISNGVCAPSTATVVLQVDNLAMASFAGGNQTVCISTPTANLSANTPTMGTGVWSIISGAGVISDPTLAVTTVTDLASSPVVLAWTISNGGCASVSSLSIQIDNLPDAAIPGSDQAICISTPTTLLNATTPTVGVGTWSLLSGNGTITSSVLANSSFTALSTGTNVLQWMVSNGVCAPNTSTMALVVDNLAMTSIAGTNQTVCVSSIAMLAANTPTSGTGNWSVVSGNASITDATLATTTASNFAVGATILEWTITNGACLSSSTMSVQADDIPDPATTGPDQMLCANSPSTILSAPSLTIGTGSWSVVTGGGTIGAPQSPTSSITALATGTNILQWTISNGVCAPNIATLAIQVDDLASVSLAGNNQTICASSPSITLSGNTPTVGTGNWSVISGSASISSATLNNSAATGFSAGINVLEWTITNGACSSTSTMSIELDEQPDLANAGANQTLCISGGTTTLSAVSPTLGTGGWSILTGTAVITNTSSANTTVGSLLPGITTLEWIVSNGVCAANISTLSIQVDEIPTAAVAGSNQVICGSAATLAATVPTVGTGLWSVISGSAVVVSPTTATTELSGITSGTTVLEWVVANGVCIPSSSTISIITSDLPGSVTAGNDATICPATFTMSANPSPFGVWSVLSGSGTISNPFDAQTEIIGLGFGQNVFKWSVGSGNCPVIADSVVITRDDAPEVAVTGNDTTINVNRIVLNANKPVKGFGVWQLVTGLCTFADSLDNNSLATDLGSGDNVVKWKISNSCGFTEDEIKITVINLMIPNAISPNADGKNDFFVISDLDKYNTVQITVFNRWGAMVFEDDNYKNNWQGTNMQNVPLTEDTYFYTLKLDGTTKTGFIIIKR